MTIYRNSNIETLKFLSANLQVNGFVVEALVTPENEWVGGNPYIVTSATNRDIMSALRGSK